MVRAGADFSELEKELAKAQKQLGKLGKDITNAGKNLTLGLTAPILGVAGASIKLASDLKEVQNVVDTAFGDSAKEVDKWAKTAIEKYGLSELSAKQFAGTMRAMTGSMGLSAEEADKMSLGLSGLAGDMASFYNLDPTEAFDKLKSAIAGETEPMKALGVNMSVANMEAYALTQGVNKAWNEMSAAEQATLRYNYIMEATKNAQGDFAKTNTGFANSMRVVKEQLKSIGAQLGALLLPFLEKVLGKFREWLTVLQSLSPEAQKTILIVAGIAAAIGPLLFVIGQMITMGAAIAGWAKGISVALMAVKAGTSGVGAVMTAVFGPVGITMLVIAGIAALVAGLVWLWNNNEAFKNFVINTWNAIVAFMTPILQYIRDVIVQAWADVSAIVMPYIEQLKVFIIDSWNYIQTTLIPILQNIWKVIVDAWNYIWKTLKPILQTLKDTIKAAWEFILTFITIALDKISTVVRVGFEIVKSIFSTVTEAIKYIWSNFGDIIIRQIQNAWDTITTVVQAATSIVKGIFEAFTGLITGDWEKCWNGLKGIVEGVWDGISGVVKGGINYLIGAINSFIRGLGSIKIPDWVPGVGGKSFSIPEIPYLAKGTDYFKGGLAIVGEEGPELVSMPRGAKVTPNDKTMDLLGKARKMELVLNIDGRQFARALAPFTGEESAVFNLRTGGAF